MKKSLKVEYFVLPVLCLFLSGCGLLNGYNNESLYSEQVKSVYMEMFDSQSFRRGMEYELTDAIAKRIEAQTPYKIIDDRNRADTVLGGRIVSAGMGVLNSERQTGRALEKEVELIAVVTWKNLKTGEIMISDQRVAAAASYSEWQNQGFKYGSTLAANKLAEKIVELMEKPWQ